MAIYFFTTWIVSFQKSLPFCQSCQLNCKCFHIVHYNCILCSNGPLPFLALQSLWLSSFTSVWMQNYKFCCSHWGRLLYNIYFFDLVLFYFTYFQILLPIQLLLLAVMRYFFTFKMCNKVIALGTFILSEAVVMVMAIPVSATVVHAKLLIQSLIDSAFNYISWGISEILKHLIIFQLCGYSSCILYF